MVCTDETQNFPVWLHSDFRGNILFDFKTQKRFQSFYSILCKIELSPLTSHNVPFSSGKQFAPHRFLWKWPDITKPTTKAIFQAIGEAPPFLCVFTELILNSDVATTLHGNRFWKVTTACESKWHGGKQDKMSQYNTDSSFINSLLTAVPFETASVNLYELDVRVGGTMGNVPFWTWPSVTCGTTDSSRQRTNWPPYKHILHRLAIILAGYFGGCTTVGCVGETLLAQHRPAFRGQFITGRVISPSIPDPTMLRVRGQSGKRVL